MIIDLEKDVQLSIYKSLVSSMGEYLFKLPMSSFNVKFEKIIAKGKKCIPTDSGAQEILIKVLTGAQNDNANSSAVLQHLFNDRFSDLPVPVRPDYYVEDNKNKHLVAYWCCNDIVSDKIDSLLNLGENSKQGYWTNDQGIKVKLNIGEK